MVDDSEDDVWSDVVRLARLEAVLGTTLGDARVDAVQRFVEGGIREDTDLDFKQTLYGASDGDKRALAGDVAALANTVGGLLVLGVRDEDAIAVELTPVDLSDAEELRIRQIVAANVAPHISLLIHRVPKTDNPNSGFYLLEVPRSSAAPHAVVLPSGLRYPRRDGAGIRWLAESEVADAYRNRFLAARDQIERLHTVRMEGEESLPALDMYAWLSIAMVPDNPGEMPLTQARVEQLRNYPRSVPGPRLVGSRLIESTAESSAGFRRVLLTLSPDAEGQPRDGVLHLHVDGSGYAGVIVGRQRPQGRDGSPPEEVEVGDELLTQEVIHAVSVLSDHATRNAGVSGEAAVEATLLSAWPMHLGHSRGFAGDSWGRTIARAPIGQRTMSLDELGVGPTAIAIAARMVLNDLVQGFGIAESPQITAAGAVRHRYFLNGAHLRDAAPEQRGALDVDDGTL